VELSDKLAKSDANRVANLAEEELSLTVIAQKAHISVYHFARLFKSVMGLTPYQFVVQARMEKAEQLSGFYDLFIA